jgi:predicted ATP-grasp superfamily ATP-dependent carboligase
MNWKLYKNELIVVASLLLMLSAILYKNNQISSRAQEMLSTKKTVREFRELITLQKTWADKKISKKINKLEKIVPSSKVKWSKKGKKLTASYKDLDPKELNKLIKNILSMAAQIQELKINRNDSSYDVEFKCKW